MNLRLALEEDAAAMLAIYAQYIDTSVTFEYTLPSTEEFARRVREVTAVYPWLICEEDGQVIGYAYAHRYRERAAYDWCVEMSVYVDRSRHGRGVGHKMYGALEAILRCQGVRNLYAVVTQPNEKSNAFHASMGFTAAGLQTKVGYKAGAWHDVCIFEKRIAPCEEKPEPIVPIVELDTPEGRWQLQ